MIEGNLIESLIIVVLFSTAIGLALNRFKIERLQSIMISAYFAIILLLSVFICNFFLENIMTFVNNNINFLMVIVGMVSVFVGFRLIYELKNKTKLPFSIVKEKPHYNKNISRIKIFFKRISDNSSIPLLFVISYISFLIHILYTSPKVWIPVIQLSFIFSIISILLIVGIVYLFKIFNINSGIIVGIFSIFTGLYSLFVYMFVPALQGALKAETPLIQLTDLNMLFYFLAILIASVLLGFLLKRTKKFSHLS
ncbi:hypothetical protein [Methanobrevibacter curvatus]|uniref:Uncharacterized protein n=1 Tax=Methanobrevibacter curvatus TaxID=49547 RepID=A0A166DR93_9EURY|nr:hypothetical protein [Methanobrevibacter curvatus]KZX15871.1 hypothetical protein MBCUR_01830 [Methanobrevibacter curvatus]